MSRHATMEPREGTCTKPYKFIGFGAMDVTKPYKFIGFGAMDVTKTYKFIGFGALTACARSAHGLVSGPRGPSPGPHCHEVTVASPPSQAAPHSSAVVLAGLRAKIKIGNFWIRAGIGPKPMIALGKWQSGPSPGTPRAKEKIKNLFKHSQDRIQS